MGADGQRALRPDSNERLLLEAPLYRLLEISPSESTDRWSRGAGRRVVLKGFVDYEQF